MSRWRQDANGATTVLGTGQPRGNSLSHSANVTAEPAGGGSPRHKGTGSEARGKEPGRRPPLEPLDTREMGGHAGCGGGGGGSYALAWRLPRGGFSPAPPPLRPCVSGTGEKHGAGPPSLPAVSPLCELCIAPTVATGFR